MDPVDVKIVTVFNTPFGTYAVGEIVSSGFTPGANFTSKATYTWVDDVHHKKGTSNADGYGTVDADGNATYYCVLGPVSGGTLSGVIQEHSATFSQEVTW